MRSSRILTCPTRPSQRVRIADLTRADTDAEVVLEVMQGMGTPARPKPGAVPPLRERASYTLDPGYWAQRNFPPVDQAPWTHGGPPVCQHAD